MIMLKGLNPLSFSYQGNPGNPRTPSSRSFSRWFVGSIVSSTEIQTDNITAPHMNEVHSACNASYSRDFCLIWLSSFTNGLLSSLAYSIHIRKDVQDYGAHRSLTIFGYQEIYVTRSPWMELISSKNNASSMGFNVTPKINKGFIKLKSIRIRRKSAPKGTKHCIRSVDQSPDGLEMRA